MSPKTSLTIDLGRAAGKSLRLGITQELTSQKLRGFRLDELSRPAACCATLTKGQQAMTLAMVYPEPAKLKRGSLETKQPDVHKTRLSQARAVLRYSPQLAATARMNRPKSTLL
jgi:hypothetical protein